MAHQLDLRGRGGHEEQVAQVGLYRLGGRLGATRAEPGRRGYLQRAGRQERACIDHEGAQEAAGLHGQVDGDLLHHRFQRRAVRAQFLQRRLTLERRAGLLGRFSAGRSGREQRRAPRRRLQPDRRRGGGLAGRAVGDGLGGGRGAASRTAVSRGAASRTAVSRGAGSRAAVARAAVCSAARAFGARALGTGWIRRLARSRLLTGLTCGGRAEAGPVPLDQREAGPRCNRIQVQRKPGNQPVGLDRRVGGEQEGRVVDREPQEERFARQVLRQLCDPFGDLSVYAGLVLGIGQAVDIGMWSFVPGLRLEDAAGHAPEHGGRVTARGFPAQHERGVGVDEDAVVRRRVENHAVQWADREMIQCRARIADRTRPRTPSVRW